MSTWVYSPHTGGKIIPPAVRARTERRIVDYAEKHYEESSLESTCASVVLSATSTPTPNRICHAAVRLLGGRRAIIGSIGCEIRPCISAGFVTSETKTAGVLPCTLMPTKSTNQAF